MNSSDGSECGYKVGKLHTCNVIKEAILQKETPKRAWSSMERILQVKVDVSMFGLLERAL